MYTLPPIFERPSLKELIEEKKKEEMIRTGRVRAIFYYIDVPEDKLLGFVKKRRKLTLTTGEPIKIFDFDGEIREDGMINVYELVRGYRYMEVLPVLRWTNKQLEERLEKLIADFGTDIRKLVEERYYRYALEIPLVYWILQNYKYFVKRFV